MGDIECIQTTVRTLPFKVMQLNFLSEKLQEFYKGMALFVVAKQLFLWSL